MKETKINYVNQKGIYNGISKYSGLVYCGNCGSLYYSNSDHGRIFYNCSNKKLHGCAACSNPNIGEKQLDEYIAFLRTIQLKKIRADDRSILSGLVYRALEGKKKQLNTHDDKKKDELIQRRDENTRALSNLYMQRAKETTITAAIDPVIKELEEEVEVENKQIIDLSKTNDTIRKESNAMYEEYKAVIKTIDLQGNYKSDMDVLSAISKIRVFEVELANGTRKVDIQAEIRYRKTLFDALINNGVRVSEQLKKGLAYSEPIKSTHSLHDAEIDDIMKEINGF